MKIIKDSKLLLKIFSALIALVLWFAVTYTEDPTINQHLRNLPIYFQDEARLAEQGLIVVDKDELPSLSAVIRGKRSKVIESLDMVSASIDTSTITSPGQHEVDVNYNYPAASVSLSRSKYSKIAVIVEKLASREIPIKIKSTTDKKSKDQIIELDSTLDSLTIKGAQSFINKVAFALVEVDETEIWSNGTTSFPYTLYDNDGNILIEENISFKSNITIPITHTLYNRAEVPVKILLDDTLKSDNALKINKQSISNVTIGYSGEEKPDALYAVLKKDKLDNSGAVTLDIDVPDGIYIHSDKTSVDVEYELQKKSVHEIEVAILPTNVPERKEITITPKKIHVRAKCTDTDATSRKISVVLDASKITSDREEVVILTVTPEENIDIIGTYTASAILH